MKRLFIVAFALALLLPPGLAFGERRSPPMHEGRGPAAWARLSPEQKERLQALHRRLLEELAPLQGSLYARHLELKALWSDPKATPASLEGKEREAFEVFRQIQEKALKYRLEARSLLSPHQIAQFQGGLWLFRGPRMGPGQGYWMDRRGRLGWGCWEDSHE